MVEHNEREQKLQPALSQAVRPDPPPTADLERIFQEHHERVLRAAFRVTGNVEDAQDVLQTVFLRLIRRKKGAAHLSDSPGSYLHRAAVNAGLDLVRSRKAARSTPLEVVEPMLAGAEEHAPDRLQYGAEIRERIRVALGKMSAKAAEIFVLRYFEGYGNHEIAKMLGTSRSTINVILHRTRHKLREEIGPCVGEEQ